MRFSAVVVYPGVLIAMAAVHADDKGPQDFDTAKAWQQMQQQLLRQFDANRDGKLTGQEQLLAQEAMRRQGVNLGIPPGGFPGAEQFNKQFDRDGDGKLSPTEKMAAQAAYQRMLNAGKAGSGGGVARGKVPGQGPLVNPPAGDQKPDKVPPLIKRFDKDGDGKLNDTEKAAAQAELKKGKSSTAKDKGSKDKDAKAKDGKGAKEEPPAEKGK